MSISSVMIVTQKMFDSRDYFACTLLIAQKSIFWQLRKKALIALIINSAILVSFSYHS